MAHQLAHHRDRIGYWHGRHGRLRRPHRRPTGRPRPRRRLRASCSGMRSDGHLRNPVGRPDLTTAFAVPGANAACAFHHAGGHGACRVLLPCNLPATTESAGTGNCLHTSHFPDAQFFAICEASVHDAACSSAGASRRWRNGSAPPSTRSAQPVSLTEAGVAFRSLAEEVVRQLYQGREEIHPPPHVASAIKGRRYRQLRRELFPR